MGVAIGLVVALAAAGAVGARYVVDARTFVSTENAQVDGEGVVGVDSATDGAYVTQGTPLATVYGREGLYVTARIEEGEIRHVAPGSSAEVTVNAFPGTALTGSVTQIQGGTAGTFVEFVPADTTGDAVEVGQLVAVRIALPPTEFDLVPGMNVSVRIRRS